MRVIINVKKHLIPMCKKHGSEHPYVSPLLLLSIVAALNSASWALVGPHIGSSHEDR